MRRTNSRVHSSIGTNNWRQRSKSRNKNTLQKFSNHQWKMSTNLISLYYNWSQTIFNCRQSHMSCSFEQFKLRTLLTTTEHALTIAVQYPYVIPSTRTEHKTSGNKVFIKIQIHRVGARPRAHRHNIMISQHHFQSQCLQFSLQSRE